MKFSELKVGDCFYIENGGNIYPFEKTEYVNTLPNINDDIFRWNCVSLDKKNFVYCLANLEVYPFDRDGFY